MKKLLVIALACVFALTLFGCSGQTSDGFNEDKENYEELLEIVRQEEIEFEEKDEIVFTAEKPMIEVLWDKEDDSSLSHDLFFFNKGIYESFNEVYTKDIKDKLDCSFYFMSLKNEDIACVPTINVLFQAKSMKNGKYVKPGIRMTMSLKDENFYSKDPIPDDVEVPITGIDGTIAFIFYFYPIQINERKSKFRMEFGLRSEEELANAWGNYKYYINIYRGDTCISTCRYWLVQEPTKEPVMYEWFADFFKRNLRLMV